MKRFQKFPLRRKKVEKARVVSAHELQDRYNGVNEVRLVVD